jgi:hypothetical protein
MNRRTFLTALAGVTGAAAVIDRERLVWQPRKKLISIPYLPPRKLRRFQAEMIWRPSLTYETKEQVETIFYRDCVGPLEAAVRKQLPLNPRFVPSAAPDWIDFQRPAVTLPHGRILMAYDAFTDEHICRVDCLVRE